MQAPLVFDYTGEFCAVTAGDTTVESTAGHPYWVVDGDGLDDRPVPRDVPALDVAKARGGRWVEARHLRCEQRITGQVQY